MELDRIDGHNACIVVIAPLIGRYNFTCRTIDDFPPPLNIVTAVYFKHIGI
ncbi:hypothetical protein D3C76_1067740 [compost metagenome]